MSKESKTPAEHLKVLKDHAAAMTQEINWMSLNGHLKDDDVQTAVHDIEISIHKAEKIIEALEKR